jgi:hypothetical protein
MWRTAVLLALCVAPPGRARADDGTLLSDDTWNYHSSGRVAVDGGLVVGFPAALPTGLSTGAGAGVTVGDTLTWGARASWVTATESSLPWTVTQSDLRRPDAGRSASGSGSAARWCTRPGSATRGCAPG